MAVTDESIYHPTEALLLKSPRRRYAMYVSPLHWQLRSLISAEGRRYVYAPGGAGNTYIQRLDTTTGVIDSIRVLSFSPRCLVAKNKWVCCGGEYGEFTATRIDDDEDAGQPRSLHNLSRGFRLAKSKRMGKERVNCITLWFPPARDDTFVGAYDQPVAVLANNDKTVTIVNLPEWEATVGSELMPELEEDEPSHDSYRLDVLKYPDFVNRAVISPDGRLLAAISDDPYLYIHERADKHAESPKAPRTRSKLDFHWKLLRKIYLKSQRLGDETSSRGSFAVCFSGSGRYLAVGTQYGMISVFDVAAFYEPGVDPFLTAFTSSRPNSEQGAVRDMAFCPGPYDLLAWTEDRGRFGVADLRRNFLSRQIETLNSSADGLEHVRVQRDASGSSRLAEGARTGSTRGAEWTPESSLLRRSEISRHHYPLTPEETMVLEALQENRRRRETRETRTTTVQPGSTLARLNPWLDRAAGRATTANAGDSSRSRQRSTSVSRGATSFFTNLYQASRENSNESDSQQDTTLPLAWRSTRQTAARRITRPSDPDSGGDEPAGGGPSATTAAAASRESRVVALARSAWADLHVLYDIGAAAEDPTTESGSGGSGSGRYDRASEVARAAAIGLAAQNDRDERRASPAAIGPLFGNLARDAYTLRRAGIAGLLETAPDPDETAGLSWSDDGRVLFIACEDGIYEYHVNVVARKLFPSITMR